MNVNDVSITTPIPVENLNEAIFSKQKELVDKYKIIEGIEWAFQYPSQNISTSSGQKLIKDFLWRTTEEICEAYEAKDTPAHLKEELIDAIHFIVEGAIISDIGPNDLAEIKDILLTEPEDFDADFFYPIYKMGLVGNTLKNKTWKQTQVKTDKAKFKVLYKEAWVELIRLCKCFMTTEEIGEYYLKKNAVNNFRIESEY